MITIHQDEARWQRTRDALRVVCAHARANHFVTAHLGRNAIPLHRLFLVPARSASGSRVVDEQTGHAYPLDPGVALVLPARRLYRFDFVAGLHLVGFHAGLEGPGGVDVLDGALTIAHDSGNHAAAAQAWDAVTLATPGAWLIAEGQLRLQLGRSTTVSWEQVERATAAARHWHKTIQRLERAPSGGADVAVLARAAGISRQHFTRRFTADFGCSPRTWQQRQLARRVVERLLADDTPFEELAADFGFSDAFAFSRFVLRQTGMRPSVWRKQGLAVG